MIQGFDIKVLAKLQTIYDLITSSPPGSTTWGSITGTLSSQTDLNTVLSGKFNNPTGTTSQYIRGDGSLATFPTTGGGIPHTTASGTDTYTATVSGVTSYADGDAYLVRFTNGNTTTATLNINGIGAASLYRNNDGPLVPGDILDGAEMLCVYNSTTPSFQCIGTSPNTLLSYVTNDDTVTITKGQPVYASGGVGDRLKVKRAYNTGDSTSAQTIGLVFSTSIAAGQKGIIIMQGLLTGLSILPTSTWADSDPVYLGPTAGTITPTKQYAPNHLVYLGFVTTASNGSAGRLYVRVQNGYEMDELHNVQARTPSLNDTLYYDNAVSPAQWKTASIATILGYTPYNGSTNPNGYITSSALTGYLTAATAASTYQPIISLTTTGTSGAATLVGNTLNIPQYSSGSGSTTQIFSFQLANVAAASTTTWVGVGVTAGSNETTSTLVMPVACTLSDMYTMHYSTAQPATGSQVFTVRKNGVDTALAITIAAGSAPTTTPYSNLANSVSFAVGDKFAVRRVNNATTTGGAVNGLSFKMVI